MTQKWKKETVEQLILCVQQYPSLYNVQSPDYVDRIKNAQCWNQILLDLLVLDPGLDLKEIQRKWRNLRVQFTKEERFVKNSKKSGAGLLDIYVPKLWCYDLLSFPKSHIAMRGSKDNIENINPENVVTLYVEKDEIMEETSQEPEMKEELWLLEDISDDLPDEHYNNGPSHSKQSREHREEKYDIENKPPKKNSRRINL
ncbi:uncharacterized protein [Musca autumnalis]|uniref:uncharacterized protein n=1 Tax=Musca autumnalis TaxID=221902 RepID=UPI003CEADFDA